MKVEGYTFAAIGVFLVVVDVAYWLLSKDPTGTTCILLSGMLAGLIAYYLMFTGRTGSARARRTSATPRSPTAPVRSASSAPFSYWPIMLAAAFATTSTGIFFGPWLFVIGFVSVAFTAAGLLFEYYVGKGAAAQAAAHSAEHGAFGH